MLARWITFPGRTLSLRCATPLELTRAGRMRVVNKTSAVLSVATAMSTSALR